VLGQNEGKAVINIGKNQGVAKDFQFNIYKEVAVEGSGARVKQKKGTLKISDVDKDTALGIPSEEGMVVEKGMVVEEF
jgi:hypothetical protein